MIPIDESLFLEDLDIFKEHLLPIINDERMASGLAAFTEQEATDHYLDLLNQYRSADSNRSAGKSDT